MDNPSNVMNSKQIAVIAALAALSIGSNYAMISLYNVKLMDLIVFVSGFCFGPVVGAFTGIVSWGVYGTLNPFGFSFHIWIATMLSESIYGIAGALARKALHPDGLSDFKNQRINACILFGSLGIFLTFVYDIITNIVFGYVNDWNILFAIIIGFVPMGIVHVLSNAFFFGIGCGPAVTAILKVVGGKDFDNSRK